MSRIWKYSVFGFNISSQLELPELVEEDFELPDVHIILSSTPKKIKNPKASGVLFQSSSSEFLFKLNSVGSYYVRNGNEITIERLNKSSNEELRLFLLGSSFGALIHQNNLLPFHGSTIISKGKAYSIGGSSGAGKSTLAASLVKRGYSLLADDISVIKTSKNRQFVYPGIPHLKLWHDVLEKLGDNVTNLHRVRPQLHKYRKPILENCSHQPTHLDTIVVLSRKNTQGFEIEELKGVEKLKIIRDNVYRFQYISGEQELKQNFIYTSEIAAKTKVFHLQRPMNPLMIEEITDFFIDNVIVMNEA